MAATRPAAAVVDGEERGAHGVGAGLAAAAKSDDGAEERVGDLGQDAGAVAGVRLGCRWRPGGRGCAAR